MPPSIQLTVASLGVEALWSITADQRGPTGQHANSRTGLAERDRHPPALLEFGAAVALRPLALKPIGLQVAWNPVAAFAGEGEVSVEKVIVLSVALATPLQPAGQL